jgi:hypothetical protein
MFTGLVGAASENKRAENPDEEMTLDDSMLVCLLEFCLLGQVKRTESGGKKSTVLCDRSVWVEQ